MPSGAKKRKAAKKKQVHNPSSTSPHQENDSQDPLVEVVKREASSSEDKAKDVHEEEGNVEIKTGSKSSSSSSSSDSSDDESQVVDKNVVILEPAPVQSVPVIESQVPEEISPIVEAVKPVDSLLDEVSQVFDDIKNEEKKDLVVEETPVVVEEPTIVVSESGSKDDCPTSSVVVESAVKENEVEKLPLSDEKVSSEPEYVTSSTPPKDSISEVPGADCANETDTVEHSDKQATVASNPLAVQKTTSWKSCCGIFELFSGSQRN